MSRPGHAAAVRPRRPTRRPTANETGGRRATDAATTYRDLLDAAEDAREALPLKLNQLIQQLGKQPADNTLFIDWDSGIFHPGLGPNFGYLDGLVIEIGAEQPCTVAEFTRLLKNTRRPPDTNVWAEWWGRTTDTQVHGVISASGITVIVTDAV